MSQCVDSENGKETTTSNFYEKILISF